jgi:hypothetical protein
MRHIAPREKHVAAKRFTNPGDYVDKGGLACTVRPDEAGDGSSFDLQAHAVEGADTTEVNRDVVNLEQ